MVDVDVNLFSVFFSFLFVQISPPGQLDRLFSRDGSRCYIPICDGLVSDGGDLLDLVLIADSGYCRCQRTTVVIFLGTPESQSCSASAPP